MSHSSSTAAAQQQHSSSTAAAAAASSLPVHDSPGGELGWYSLCLRHLVVVREAHCCREVHLVVEAEAEGAALHRLHRAVEAAAAEAEEAWSV
jgi:hypothetical protein